MKWRASRPHSGTAKRSNSFLNLILPLLPKKCVVDQCVWWALDFRLELHHTNGPGVPTQFFGVTVQTFNSSLWYCFIPIHWGSPPSFRRACNIFKSHDVLRDGMAHLVVDLPSSLQFESWALKALPALTFFSSGELLLQSISLHKCAYETYSPMSLIM